MIPLSVPCLTGNEKKYVNECLDTNWISSLGRFVNTFEKEFAAYTGARHAVAVSSGTAALHLALIAAGVKPDEEVILPSLTFIAPVNAVTYTGACPVFVDVDRDTLGLSPAAVRKFINKNCDVNKEGRPVNRTSGRVVSALITVNIMGHAGRLDELAEVTEQYGLNFIEDNAEGAGCLYKGAHVGIKGRFGCFSFNGNKVLTTGGGGMLVTSSEEDACLVKHLSTQAKSDELYYSHDMTGYNYRMSNIQAALGLGQLEHLEEMIRRKREIHSLYEHDFNGIKTPELFTERPWCRSNYWFGVIFMPEEKRNDFIKYMAFEKIQCRPFWKPCHMHPMFHGSGQTDLPVTMEIWKRGVCFPCFQGMSGNDVKKVISVIKTFFRL